jgi:hypothetical protein
VSRIVFPVSINAVVDDVVQACHDWFPSTLKVLGGHVCHYGLYLGMHKALQQSQWGLLASLWQCGLTTTICRRAGLSVSEQAILTMSQSESAKLKAQMMSDSFVGFAYKALLVMKNSSESNKLKVVPTRQSRTAPRTNTEVLFSRMLSHTQIQAPLPNIMEASLARHPSWRIQHVKYHTTHLMPPKSSLEK